ncbi:MAG: hypothetical protein ACKVJ1_11650, partial [Verrucomicrobiia bacterium]
MTDPLTELILGYGPAPSSVQETADDKLPSPGLGEVLAFVNDSSVLGWGPRRIVIADELDRINKNFGKVRVFGKYLGFLLVDFGNRLTAFMD